MDLLRDQVWGFWGFVVMVATLVAMIYIARLQLARKALTCTVIGEETCALPPDPKAVDKAIETKKAFPSQEVVSFFETYKTILLRLENTGLSPISKSDFETPLDFRFGSSARIVGCAVVKTVPRNLHPEIKEESNKLSLTPCLLNMQDCLTISVSVCDYEGLSVEARISGIHEVRQIVSLHPLRRVVFLGMAGMICNSVGLPYIFNLPMDITLRIVLMILLGLVTSGIFVNYLQKYILGVYGFEETVNGRA